MRRPTTCTLAPWLLAAGLLLASCGTSTPPEVLDDLGATLAPVPTDDAAPTATPTVAPTTAATPTATPTPTDVCSGREDEAFIEVLEPVADATVTSPFTVAGCGNTFEAGWSWEVVLADGTVAAEGFGTMTCGNGCVGTFEELVTVSGTGAATLVVYEVSAKDGSRATEVEVPITLG